MRGAEARASRCALENADVSFAAEKNDLLFNNADAFKFFDISGRNAGFSYYTDIKLYGQLIKSAIKGNRVNINIGPDDSCAFSADSGTALQKLLAAICQKNANVFKTVFIASGVKHAVCIHTHHFARRRALSVFRHGVYHSFPKHFLTAFRQPIAAYGNIVCRQRWF